MGTNTSYEITNDVESSAVPSVAPLEVGTPTVGTEAVNENYLKSTGFDKDTIHAGTQSITTLKAITSAYRVDKKIILVEDKEKIYRWDADSTTAGDDDDVVVPDDAPGTGRWHKIADTAAGSASTYSQYSFQDYIIPADRNDGASNSGLTSTASTNPRGLSLASLKLVIGRERITVNEVAPTGGYDANGLREYEIISPKRDERVRFYGRWLNNYSSYGQHVYSDTDGDYVLISGVFDGCIVSGAQTSTSSNDIDVIVDTVDTGTNLSQRHEDIQPSYNQRTCPMSDSNTKGLGFDIHTVKYVNGSGDANLDFLISAIDLFGDATANGWGDEVAGNAYSGKQKRIVSESTNLSAPTVGDKGGSVIRYNDATDGTMKWEVNDVPEVTTTATSISSGVNAITVADTTDFEAGDLILIKDSSDMEINQVSSVGGGTTLNLTTNTINAYTTATVYVYGKTFDSASFSRDNEELMFSFTPRSMGGANGAFAGVGSGTNYKAYCDPSGKLTLSGYQIAIAYTGGVYDILYIDTSSGFWDLCFVGTGIELDMIYDGTGAPTTTFEIDGYDIGYPVSNGKTTLDTQIIASQLPYGSHRLRLKESGAGTTPCVAAFKIYGPTQSSIFIGSSATQQRGNQTARINALGEYVFNSLVGFGHTSPGTLVNIPDKGVTFETGTGGSQVWARAQNNGHNFMYYYYTDYTTNTYCEFEVLGTGFELYHYMAANAGIWDISVDGSVLNTTNFTNLTVQHTTDAAGAFNTTNGEIDFYKSTTSENNKTSFQDIFSVPTSFTVRFSASGTKNGSSSDYYMVWQAYAEIGNPGFYYRTPELHTGDNPTVEYGTAEDRRIFEAVLSDSKQKTVAKIYGSSDLSNTSTSFATLPDMQKTVYSKGSYFELYFTGVLQHSASNTITTFDFTVDGVVTGKYYQNACSATSTNGREIVTLHDRVYLSEGFHHVGISWYTASGTATMSGANRILSITEV